MENEPAENTGKNVPLSHGRLSGDHVVVEDSEEIEFLYEKGYGVKVGEKLRLELVEAAYLLYRGFLEVEDDNGNKVGFWDIVKIGSKKNAEFWTILNVYSDLRNRALIAKPGVTDEEILLDWKKRGGVKRFLVRVIREGIRVGFPLFEDLFRRALESGRELVMAVVDKEGVISYYIVEGVSREGPEVLTGVPI